MSQSFRFSVSEQDAGQRLDRFLWSRLGGLSRMRIANLVAAGACLVNHSQGVAGHHLHAGDTVEITVGEGSPTAMDPEPIPLEILYEDDHLVVLVKPPGLLVHPTRNVKTGTLANALAYHMNRSRVQAEPVVRPGLVHRLDRETSGLMVVAKTPRALSVLSRHFHRRLVEKRYLALVEGIVSERESVVDAPIGRDEDRRPQWWVMEGGKPAQSRLRVIGRLANATLIELEPVTGRTNQLRIHCAYLGHPILGDKQYSGCGSGYDGRLCLHASRLAFHHPATGLWMEFTSEHNFQF